MQIRTVIRSWVVLVMVTAVGFGGTEGRAATPFPEPHNTPANSDSPTTPAKALEFTRLPEGFEATLFAAEPDVRQPIGFVTDARGRLWVAENYTYAESPVYFETKLRDRIVVLEDADGDGHFDRRQVFWDEARQLTSVEVGFGGVWAMCPPQLLFLPDRNRDDRPDGPPEIVLDGFEPGSANRHNFANGLKWGPDGWLYGRNGISAPGLVGAPGTPPAKRTALGPSLWRYHPVSRRFESVCTGTTNPWGHDWDEHGELFFINTVIGHLWHAVPGAHFKRMFGADANPRVYKLLDQTADHFHWDTREPWQDTKKGVSGSTDTAGGGHAHCGMMIYLGDNWPERYRNALFTLNIHGRRMNSDRLEQLGASYVGRHNPDLIHFEDPWFRGIELLYGPDGGVFVADWSETGECHESDGVHRTSGRIFKVTYGKPERRGPGNLEVLETSALAALQSHRNEWFARQTRRLLQERAAAGQDMKSAAAVLREQFANASTAALKLRALWALHVIGQASPAWLSERLGDPDEHLRAWAVRLLADQAPLPPELPSVLARQAAKETSGLVLLYLASSLQRLDVEKRWPLAEAVAGHEAFAADPVLPLMVWYGLMDAVSAMPEKAVAMAFKARFPLVRQFLARNVTESIGTRREPVEQLVRGLAVADPSTVQASVLTGMSEALRGWRRAAAPEAWARVQPALAQSKDETVRRLAREIAVVFGDGRATEDLKRLAVDPALDVASRQSALRALIESRTANLRELLVGLFKEHDIAPEAVRGLAALYPNEAGPILIKHYRSLYLPAREATISVLSSRPDFARILLEAVDRGVMERSSVSVFQVRQMQTFKDDSVQATLARLWPELRAITEDARQRMAGWKARLTPAVLGSADLNSGRTVWRRVCVQCHVLHGEGGQLGPDLTGSQRALLDYLLENILDPSATLALDYRLTTVELTDGRILSGVLGAKTDQTVEVQTPDQRVVARRSEIKSIDTSERSPMPEGLLDVLPFEEARDLLAYLMVPRPAEAAPASK